MPKQATAIETTNANKIFDLPVSLQPGQVNTMSFPQDSIAEMHLTPANELEVTFRDGSRVQIENFQELVNSAQSCGRDTIIQLSDNTIIYPEELNGQLAQGPVSFIEKNADGNVITALSEPKAGQIVETQVEPGKEYKMNFDFDRTASAAQAGENLIVTFKDGGVMVLKNYFTSMDSELPPALTLADGAVINSDALLTSCKLVESPSFAELVADEAKETTVAETQVEPAAGEEAVAAKKSTGEQVQNVEPAAGEEAVADIEPAAGDAGALSGGRGGYGFASEPGAVALGGINAIGAIGATQLGYQTPNYRNGPTGPNAPTTAAFVGPAAALSVVDETGPSHSVSGKVNFNFGNDGPSTTEPPVQVTGNFGASGSLTNNALTSNGQPITVSFSGGNTYTGTAGGQTVFTFVVNPDGTYTFTQNAALDHADGSDANDRIILNFGIVGIDRDGDRAPTSVNVYVYDDAPVAVDDNTSVSETMPTVTGNVTTNDKFGFDGKPEAGEQVVTKVVVNGTTYNLPADGSNVTITTANGVLTINTTGQYSYTATTKTGGEDNFVYTIQDNDGDKDTSTSDATLKVSIDDVDFTPTVTSDVKTVDETNLGPIVVNGAVTANYFSDGPGAINGSNSFSSGGSKLGGNLTSNGVAVAVTFANGTYTGTAGGQTIFTLKVNADGSYTFTQNGPLDHADKSNPDDSIELNFGIVARDADGDTANGTIKIIVKDDGPQAVDDNTNVTQAQPTVTGNVTTNDDFGSDGKPSVQPVTKVIYNGTTYDLPANGTNVTITTANGTLTINSNGQYSYTATTQTGGVDNFQYVIKDRDGDTDTSASTGTLKVTIDDVDFTPTVTSDAKVVDETNMNPTTGVTGAVTANYFSDGPGSITGTGASSFSSAGSKAGGNLTSNGVAVVVTYANGVYTGKAGNETVFTLTVNANGQYSFVLNKPLDHADKSNPNDAIDLNFGVVATDADGDKANGNIKITVLDDGPSIGPATSTIDESDFNPTGIVTGKVTADFGSDAQGSSISGNNSFTSSGSLLNGKLTTNGVAITVTQTATGYVGTANGQEVFKLTINNDGSYSYNQSKIIDHADPNNPDDVISLHFGVKATDGDGDTANSTITIDVKDDGPAVVPDPTVNVICEYGNLNIQPNGGVFAKFIVDANGSGSEVVTLKLTGLEAGWTVGTADKTGPGNTFNDFTWTNKGTFALEADGTYTWTYTLPAGQDFNGYFGFKNNGTSNDLGDLTFTATVVDHGKTATDSEDFSIIVGAPDAAARSMAYSDDLAFDDDAFSSLSDNHHKEVSSFKVVSGVNDNLPAYDQVIESHHSAEQNAIDSFVYETTVDHKPGSTADLKPEVSNWPQVVAPSAAEDINQAQQHVA